MRASIVLFVDLDERRMFSSMCRSKVRNETDAYRNGNATTGLLHCWRQKQIPSALRSLRKHVARTRRIRTHTRACVRRYAPKHGFCVEIYMDNGEAHVWMHTHTYAQRIVRKFILWHRHDIRQRGRRRVCVSQPRNSLGSETFCRLVFASCATRYNSSLICK